MVGHHSSNLKTDEQLDAMLREAGHWTVTGRSGQTLCSAASLRSAIDRAADLRLRRGRHGDMPPALGQHHRVRGADGTAQTDHRRARCEIYLTRTAANLAGDMAI